MKFGKCIRVKKQEKYIKSDQVLLRFKDVIPITNMLVGTARYTALLKFKQLMHYRNHPKKKKEKLL